MENRSPGTRKNDGSLDPGKNNVGGMLDSVKLKTGGRGIISLRWLIWDWLGPALKADPSEFVNLNIHAFLRSV